MQQSVIDNGLTKGLLGSRFENFIRKVLQKITVRRLRKNAKSKKEEETDVRRWKSLFWSIRSTSCFRW